MVFAGLDPTAGSKKPTAAAILDQNGRVLEVAQLSSDAAILDWLRRWKPDGLHLVGVDGPTALPAGVEEEAFVRGAQPEARRVAELALASRGIGCFFTTSRSFAKQWALRCVKLAQRIADAGFSVVEVYPHATKVVLWGRDYPRPKARRQARQWLCDALGQLGLAWDCLDLPTHDELDAVVAALTAYLAWRGMVEWLGRPESAIALPFERRRLPDLLFSNLTQGGRR